MEKEYWKRRKRKSLEYGMSPACGVSLIIGQDQRGACPVIDLNAWFLLGFRQEPVQQQRTDTAGRHARLQYVA